MGFVPSRVRQIVDLNFRKIKNHDDIEHSLVNDIIGVICIYPLMCPDDFNENYLRTNQVDIKSKCSSNAFMLALDSGPCADQTNIR